MCEEDRMYEYDPGIDEERAWAEEGKVAIYECGDLIGYVYPNGIIQYLEN